MKSEWVFLNEVSDMDDSKYFHSTKNWDGPGYYLKETFNSIVRWTPAQQVVDSIKEEMKLVCERLKEAKEKAKNAS